MPPLPDVQTAPLRPQDAAGLVLLLRSARPDYLAHFHPFDFTQAALLAQLTSARRDHFWSIVVGGHLAGFFMLRGLDAGFPRPAFGVFVAEPYSRCGLARHALQTALAWCARQEIPEIMLTIHPANLTARRIYEEAGFRPTGTLSEKGQTIMTRPVQPV